MTTDKKLSDLNAKTTIVSNDTLLLNDSEVGSDISKKVTASNLLGLRTDQDLKTTSSPSFERLTLVDTGLSGTSSILSLSHDGGQALEITNPDTGGDSIFIGMSDSSFGIGGGKLFFTPTAGSSTASILTMDIGNERLGINNTSPSVDFQIDANNNGFNIITGFKNNNSTESGGNAVGFGFLNESGGDWWKAAIVHERTSGWGRGDLKFLTNDDNDSTEVSLTDSRMTIARDGDVFIEGGDLTLERGELILQSSDDQETLLQFDMDRDWLFKQSGTDASTELSLADRGGGKSFNIENLTNDKVFTVTAKQQTDTSGQIISINPVTTVSSQIGALFAGNENMTLPTGSLVTFRNDGTGNGLYIDQNGS